MPELPEVETTRRGVKSYCEGHTVRSVVVRESRLRWPVIADLGKVLRRQRIHTVSRRAKYLLFEMDKGTLLVHLGMSGSLRVMLADEAPQKHDHIDISLSSGATLRYNDPRRFGSVQWFDRAEDIAPLSRLGPEPLTAEFDGRHLYELSRGRRAPVKTFLMDGAVVVGVGNIYANESLFLAGIRPDRSANRVSLQRYEVLAKHVKQVLTNAIDQGGTTLRDFVGGDGKPGYFAQQLYVYGRGKEACKRCNGQLRGQVIGQRATVYCIACQR